MKLIKIWQKFLVFILGILGLTSCNSTSSTINGGDENICLYGCPHADYSVNISVKDNNNNNLDNIKIIVKTKVFNGEFITLDSLYSHQGFSNYTYSDVSDSLSLRLIFKDSENKYVEDSTEFTLLAKNDKNNSDFYYIGSDSKDVEMILKNK